MFYSGVEEIQSSVRRAVHKYGSTVPVVIDGSRFRLFDATFVDMLAAIAKDLSAPNTPSQGTLLLLQSMPVNLQQRQQLLANNNNLRFSPNRFPTEIDFK